MKRHTKSLAAVLALFAVAFAVVSLTHCASATPQQKADAAETTFASSMLACVEKSATIEQSHACRAEVRAKWHVDGGAVQP